MSKIIKVYFSPSETTKKVVGLIADNFNEESEICDLLYFNGEKSFSSDDIVIVGMPVFAGRIPKTARERLSKLKDRKLKNMQKDFSDFEANIIEKTSILKEKQKEVNQKINNMNEVVENINKFYDIIS